MSDKSTLLKPLAFIVEDDRKLGEIFARAFEEAGFMTEIIEDGDIAAVRLVVKRPSVVILDLQLPYVWGDEILRQIRADSRVADTYVIVATAHPSLAEEIKTLANMALTKPVSFRQLRDIAQGLYQEFSSESHRDTP